MNPVSQELTIAIVTLLAAIVGVIKSWQAERRASDIHTIVNSQRDAMIAEIAGLKLLLAEALKVKPPNPPSFNDR